MTSIDANLLLYALNTASPWHAAARRCLEEFSGRADVAVSEFILVEYYVLLRNPAVLKHPLPAPEAAQVVAHYRRHPRWRLLGFPSGSLDLHDRMWARAAESSFARRRIFDTRTALSLLRHGVTEFATSNVNHFKEFGFHRVWNPLEDGTAG